MEERGSKYYFSENDLEMMKEVKENLRDKFGASELLITVPVVSHRAVCDYGISIRECTKYPRHVDVDKYLDMLKEIFGTEDVNMYRSPYKENTVMISIYNVRLTENKLE